MSIWGNLNFKNLTEVNYNEVNNLRRLEGAAQPRVHPAWNSEALVQLTRLLAGTVATFSALFPFQDFWLLAEDRKLHVEKNQTGTRENTYVWHLHTFILQKMVPFPTFFKELCTIWLPQAELHPLPLASMRKNPALPGFSKRTDFGVQIELKQIFCIIWQRFFAKLISQMHSPLCGL